MECFDLVKAYKVVYGYKFQAFCLIISGSSSSSGHKRTHSASEGSVEEVVPKEKHSSKERHRTREKPGKTGAQAKEESDVIELSSGSEDVRHKRKREEPRRHTDLKREVDGKHGMNLVAYL